jgi:hypothetical protein
MHPGNYIKKVADAYRIRGCEGANKFFNQNLQETQGIIILVDIAGFTNIIKKLL